MAPLRDGRDLAAMCDRRRYLAAQRDGKPFAVRREVFAGIPNPAGRTGNHQPRQWRDSRRQSAVELVTGYSAEKHRQNNFSLDIWANPEDRAEWLQISAGAKC